MTRMRISHNYHEVKTFNSETFCKICRLATPRVCEWCGACVACHKGPTAEKSY